MTTPSTGAPRKVKWSHMDHWRSPSPAVPIDQWQSRKLLRPILEG